MLYYNYANSYPVSGLNPYYQAPHYMGSVPMYPCPYLSDLGYRSPDLIPNLPDSWSFGPLKVEWAFDGESINVVLKMFEEAVRDLVLTLSTPSISVTTTIGNATINLRVNADFAKKQIYLAGAVCFDTVCTTFNNTLIASW